VATRQRPEAVRRQCIIFNILISLAEMSNLAKKPNYNFEKSRKEQDRKKKKEEKRQRKLEASRERREEPSADGQVTGDAPGDQSLHGG
jgi:sortase (surface protein transpeptidase)